MSLLTTSCNRQPFYSAHFVLHREGYGFLHRRVAWWAESPDMPGWYGSRRTEQELRDMLIDAVRFYHDAPHASVMVTTEIAA